MMQLLGGGIVFVTLLAAMLLAFEIGWRIGLRRLQRDPAGAQTGVGALEGAVFGLMGLLIAFTFSGAAARFDGRRELLLKETSAIGTAWLRLDLLPGPAREDLRVDLRKYVDLRLAASRAHATEADAALMALEQRMWSRAVAGLQEARDARFGHLVLAALNDVFDIATARFLASQTHPPIIIYGLLLVLALVCALLAGHGMAGGKRRSWLHILAFVGSLIMAIYVTIEIEFPRRGLVRIDRYDQLLVDLRQSMR